MDRREKIEGFFYLLVLAAIFILISYFVNENISSIENIIKGYHYIFGFFLYIFFSVFMTIIAPLSSVPLVPIASSLWGWEVAGILNVISWTLGAYIAFMIASKYGKPLVKKLVKLDKIEKLEKKIPKEHIFWTVVFLRIIVPVDVLSYTLGLFSSIKVGKYLLATVIGVFPFAFLFSYMGEAELKEQIFSVIGFFVLIFLALFFKKLADLFKKREN
jgi:uncharacterized membrane protein YdjX (TVP38/TMEM64 family)